MRLISTMSPILLVLTFVILSSASPQAVDDEEPNNIRFSRLLTSKGSDVLKHSSISIQREKIPFISPEDVVPPSQSTISATFSMSSSSSSSEGEPAAIVKPLPVSLLSSKTIGEHADMILQNYRAPLFEFSERETLVSGPTSSTESSVVTSNPAADQEQNGEVVEIPRTFKPMPIEYYVQDGDNKQNMTMKVTSSVSSSIDSDNDDNGLNGILKRPSSSRSPVSVLQQITMGNKLNLTPLFSEPVKMEDEQPQQQQAEDFSDADSSVAPTTTSTEVPATTIVNAEEYYDEDEEAPTEVPSTSTTTTTTTSTTTTTTTPRPVNSRNGRTRNRGFVRFDSSTPTSEVPSRVKSTTTSTTPLTTTTTTTSTTPKEDIYRENLVIDSSRFINNKDSEEGGFNFPDFEDSPANLATAESNQPARVNVRPASSGKEYEYEYIYYYYDDDDDNSTTTTTTTARPRAPAAPAQRAPVPAKVESIGIKGAETFTAEKEPSKFSLPAEPVGNQLERSRGSKTFADQQEQVYSHTVEQRPQTRQREPESSFTVPEPLPPQQRRPFITDYQDEYYQPQIVQDEYPEPLKTNQPVVIKESNLVQSAPVSEATAPPTRATTTRPTPTTTTTTTERYVEITEPVPTPSPSPKSRFRTTKQFDSPPANQFVSLPVENGNEAPIPDHRPIYKELTSRRIPQRQPVAEVSSTVETTPQEPVRDRLPSRTRFPPRVSPTSSQEEVTPEEEEITQFKPVERIPPHAPSRQSLPPQQIQEQVQPVRQYQEVTRQRVEPVAREPPQQIQEEQPVRQYEVSRQPPVRHQEQAEYDPPVTTSTNPPRVLDPEQEAKAKDNYARQKSINDLYALTRLHQAINTRVPIRKELQQQPSPSPSRVPPKIAGGFISSSEVAETPENYDEPRTYLPTASTTTTTTTTAEITTPVEVSSEAPVRPRLPGGSRGGFRSRTRPTAATPSVSSTNETPTIPARPANRFAGRRRFPQGGATTPQVPESSVGTVEPATFASPQPTPVRAPGRNRFAGRLRTSTARTTEVAEDVVAVDHSNTEADQEAPKPPPRRQRPHGFQNRRKQFAQQGPTEVTEGADSPVPPQPSNAVPAEKRRPNFVKRPGPGPIVGRPLRPRTSTTPAPEQSEGEEQQEVASPSHLPSPAPSEAVETEQEHEPVISQKVTVSSSTTTSESSPEPPRRGSAGVLGRLRNRSKPGGPLVPITQAIPTTTQAPVAAPPAERKPSRLNGILNRRKNGPAIAAEASPTNIVSQTVAHEGAPNNGQEPEDKDKVYEFVPPQGGVIVQVSSVVSESQEVSDNAGEVTDDQSSTVSSTPGSILSRLKSQRKPGALFRKKTE